MRCPDCGSMQVKVSDSRAAGTTRVVAGREKRLTPECVEKEWGSNYIWRRRKCADCRITWSTVEVAVNREGYQKC